MNFHELISVKGFNAKKLNVDAIMEIESKLPSNRSAVIDSNIAAQGLMITLEGQNICQEKIALMDRYLGLLEGKKNKAWAEAALVKAKNLGHKTAKDKEWYALSDDDYITVCNEISLAKAGKKFLENKASFFSGWHYAFKSFLNRDFSLEKVAGHNFYGYNENVRSDDDQSKVSDFGKKTDNFVDEDDLW